MGYAELTTNDPNPIKRWLQRQRFIDAINTVARISSGGGSRVLDFGSGNGEFIRLMAQKVSYEWYVYEPTPSLMAEATMNLSKVQRVTFLENTSSMEGASFDQVYCLEVFEHLPEEETLLAILEIRRLLKPGGFAIIGVPHELYLPALVKGVFRGVRRYGDFDSDPRNILGAVIGYPPSIRPVSEIAPGKKYHFHHLGFDFRTLEKKFAANFDIEKKWYSPFRCLGVLINSEVYFLLRVR